MYFRHEQWLAIIRAHQGIEKFSIIQYISTLNIKSLFRISGFNVALTAFTIALSAATLLGCIVLAVIFYLLRRRREQKYAVAKPLLKTTPLPMSSGLLKLKTDYSERFYSDSEDSGAIVNRLNGHHTDDSLADELSDYEFTGRRSSSVQSNSSSDNLLLSSYEEAANESRTPGSSASNSPNISARICFLNLTLKYNFHQESLDVVLTNVQSPPKPKGTSKGLFIVMQLFLRKDKGEFEDFNTIHKSEMRNYSKSVLFNEDFKFEALKSHELQAISIRLSLCSHDRFSRVQSLGEFIVNLNEVTFDPMQPLVLQRRLTQVCDDWCIDSYRISLSILASVFLAIVFSKIIRLSGVTSGGITVNYNFI